MMRIFLLLLLLPLLLASCVFDAAGVSVELDTSAGDAALVDASSAESMPADAALVDAALADAALVDTTPVDAPLLPDAGTVDPLKPFGAAKAIAALNSGASEDDPTLTGDMLEIYFDRGGDLYLAKRSKISAAWSTPQPVAALNSSSGETTPAITPDGLTIYFSSSRPGGPGGGDLYRSARASRAAAWSTPVLVPVVNTAQRENGPAPAPDELTLVFASARSGSAGDDLYISTRAAKTAAWSAPVKLAAANSSSDEGDCWLGTTALYFASTRPGKGGWEILLSLRTGSTFAAPKAAGSLNSSANDGDPWLSPDLKTIIFASDRAGSWDLYTATR